MKPLASFMTTILLLSVFASMFLIKSVNGPESQVFSDEFDSPTLNPCWTWVDPGADCSYSLTANPGYLRISVPHYGNDLYPWSNYDAPRLLQPASGDFIITSKLLFNPLYSSQGAGILIWVDEDNFLRLDRLAHGSPESRQCVDLSGEQDGVWHYFAETPYAGTSTYLRLERTGSTFTAKYSSDGNNWAVLNSITFPFTDPVNVGLFVINEWQDNPIYADFDYFRVNGGAPQGDFSIVSVEPIQVVEKPQVGVFCPVLVSGKPTVFNVTIDSTFASTQLTAINITYPSGLNIEFRGISIFPTLHSYYLPLYPYRFIPTLKEGIFQTVEVGINPHKDPSEPTYTNNKKPKDFVVADTKGFPNGIVFRPVDIDLCPRELSKMANNSMWFLRATYPLNISQTSYKNQTATIYSDGMSAGGTLRYLNILAWLSKLDRLVGIVKDGWFDSKGLKDKKGLAFTTGLTKAALATNGYYTVAAHEIGHTMQLEDEKTENPAMGYWVEGDELMIDGNRLFHTCFMGSIAPQTWPYDANTERRAWIEKSCYEYLFKKMLKNGNDPELLLVNGMVSRNGTTLLDEFYRIPDGVPDYVQDSTGNFSVKLLDSNGQLLSQVSLNLTFMGSEDVRPFSFTIPYNQNASRISIIYNGSIVANRTISPNSPSVHLITPNGGEVYNEGENVAISWQSDDADGDSLVYTVLYSEDNGSSWLPITTGLNETTLDWTIPITPSTDKYIIKVIATDGVNTGEDVSNTPFTILRHDVETTNVLTSKTVVGEGYTLPINITVQNNGNYTETLNLEVHVNTTTIHTQALALTCGNSTTITLSWNTSGFAKGNYTISAYAWPVPSETDTTDNRYIDGWILVTRTGDFGSIAGGYYDFDDQCDYQDLFLFRKAYVEAYHLLCDFDNDLDVDYLDLFQFRQCYIAA